MIAVIRDAWVFGVTGQLWREDLHGDGTIKARIARPIYLAHAPGTDQGENLIRAEARTCLQGHLLPRIMTCRATNP